MDRESKLLACWRYYIGKTLKSRDWIGPSYDSDVPGQGSVGVS